MSSIPRLFTGFVDDAAVFPPGNAPLPDAVSDHRTHRTSWYADLVGPLLVRASQFAELAELTRPGESLEVGIIGDTGIAGVDQALGQLTRDTRIVVRQVEVPVAKRSEDPLPGLSALRAAELRWNEFREGPLRVYAEIPLTYGCLAALDRLAEQPGDPPEGRDEGPGLVAGGHPRVLPKFRTGGLAAELFPTPDELATVMVACAERELRFKLTAGLHHAVRHTDRTTGFTHHGFLNVLAACEVAARGDIVPTVAGVLRESEPEPLAAMVAPMLPDARPLWAGFGTCSVSEPLDDLLALDLLQTEPA